MKEIVENKIEKSMIRKKHIFTKKTKLYIEGIIYILSIILVILINNSAPLYVKMIPLLIILGIIGVRLFNRPVVTTVFGIVTAMCITKISGINNIYQILFNSFGDGILIALGEFIGYYGYISYRYMKMKKNFKSKKAIKIYVLTIILLFLAIIAQNYLNGNYYTYVKCKKNLQNYLINNYEDYNNFEIINSNYTFFNKMQYIFKVKNNVRNITSNFYIYLNDINIINDEYKNIVLDKENTELMSELVNYINNNNYKFDFDIGIKYLDNDNISIEIYKDVDILDDIKKQELTSNIVYFINSIKQFKKYNKIEEISISINCLNNQKLSINCFIDFNDFINNTNYDQILMKKYIDEALNEEFFDLND